MLARAQEARVLQVLRDCPSGTIRAYCLEHLAATGKIPPAQVADLSKATARRSTAASATQTDTDDLPAEGHAENLSRHGTR